MRKDTWDLTLIIVLKCIIDLFALLYCYYFSIFEEFLPTSAKSYQLPQWGINQRKRHIFQPIPFVSYFLRHYRDKTKCCHQAYTNVVCPLHHFISIINSLRAESGYCLRPPASCPPLWSHTQTQCSIKVYRLRYGTGTVVHLHKMPSTILLMFFSSSLETVERKTMKNNFTSF